MNELTITTMSNLANKELAKNLKVIVSATAAENKSAWAKAFAYAEIDINELYADDFENRKKFCEAIGITGGRLSQRTKAVQFVLDQNLYAEDKNGAVDTNKIYTTVDNAYLLACLDNYDEFNEYCTANHYDPLSMSQAALKKLIKDYKNIYDVSEETAEEIATEAAETETGDTQDVKSERDKAIQTILELMGDYGITIEELTGFYSV